MDPFTMARSILGDTALTADQLAQLRALNTRYFTEMHAIRHSSADVADADRRRALLEQSIRAGLRDILTDEQRELLDRAEGPSR